MFKPKTLLLLTLVTFTPQISFAVWWNPFSWFGTSKVQTVIKPIVQKDTLSDTSTSTSLVKNNALEPGKIDTTSKAKTQTKNNNALDSGNNFIKPKVDFNEPREDIDAPNKATVQLMGTAVAPVVTKEVTLSLVTTTGGIVLFSPENTVACYEDDTCKKTFTTNKKLTLRAAPKEGYSVQGWSEASCGKSLDCNITLSENMTVYVRFEVTKQIPATGRITSLSHPSHTCYLPLGREECSLPLRWLANNAIDLRVNIDGRDFYVSTPDRETSPFATDADPQEIAKAVAENATAFVYLSLSRGPHTISLVVNGKNLDTVNVNVECPPDAIWDSIKCWQKGANRLFIFKPLPGTIITADGLDINCGYFPEKCIVGVPAGQVVHLKAKVLPGYTFSGWYGDCSGKEPTCTLTMDSSKTVGVGGK